MRTIETIEFTLGIFILPYCCFFHLLFLSLFSKKNPFCHPEQLNFYPQLVCPIQRNMYFSSIISLPSLSLLFQVVYRIIQYFYRQKVLNYGNLSLCLYMYQKQQHNHQFINFYKHFLGAYYMSASLNSQPLSNYILASLALQIIRIFS